MQNKNFFTKSRWLVTILFMLYVGQMWGDSYSWTIAVGDFGTTASPSTSLSSKGSPSKNWSVTYTWENESYIGTSLDGSRGLQLGAAKKTSGTKAYRHLTSLVLSTSGISGTISNVTVETAGASSITATVGVVVGSTTFKYNNNNTADLTSSNASYAFTGSASGTITITWSQPSTAKAIYIKSITVTYTTASCSTNPTVGNASLNGTFNMTSTTSAIGVASGTCGAGTNCSWADYGFVWSDGANTTTPTVGGTNCNKVQVETSGTATSWTGSVQPSGSTSPTSWTTGHTYYVRTYGKNSKASATYYYSETAYTFTPQSVTFKANGGTGSDKVQYMRKSTSTALTANTFTRSGYSFAGWATSSSGSVAYTDEQSVSIDADLVLHAKWSPEDYTITLNNQSATTAGSPSISVTFDASTNLTSTPAITVPEKTDYIFGGYYTETAGGGTQIIDANGDVVASASDASYTYTDASKNWKYPNNITLYAKWTEHTYTNYRTNCCTKAMLAFSEDEYADQIRQDLHGNVGSENKFELEIPFSTSSTGTSYTTEIKKLSYGSRDESAAGSACADETAASVNSSTKKVTFQAWSTNPGSNFKGQGTYRIKLIQAADGDYCQGVDYVFVDVVMRDKFVDNVNGNTTINRDGTGTAVQTPAEASLPETDECHETTRRLLGWIKETDLETWYGSTNRVRDLDDKKNDSKIVAPNTDVKTSAVTWYAVWGEEVAP